MWTLHYEKALEYDEYYDLLGHCETWGQKCVTLNTPRRLRQHAVRECFNVCRYFEENWPLNDEDLEIVHELYRLEAYQ